MVLCRDYRLREFIKGLVPVISPDLLWSPWHTGNEEVPEYHTRDILLYTLTNQHKGKV